MNISRNILLLALASIASGVQGAEAESAIPEPSVFVQQAAQSGLTEISAARMALARSKDPGIRGFAQRMVRDHEKCNQELATLASSKGIEMPREVDAEHKALLDEITAKTGDEFDRTYSQHMNMGHSTAVALYEAASNSPDPAISGFARKTLPILREHQALAEKLSGDTVKGNLPGGR